MLGCTLGAYPPVASWPSPGRRPITRHNNASPSPIAARPIRISTLRHRQSPFQAASLPGHFGYYTPVSSNRILGGLRENLRIPTLPTFPQPLFPHPERTSRFELRRSPTTAFQDNSRMVDWFSIAFRRDVVRRALTVAVVVGSLLITINHADALWQGDLSTKRLWQIGLTYLVPYCVSTYSSVSALRSLDRRHLE